MKVERSQHNAGFGSLHIRVDAEPTGKITNAVAKKAARDIDTFLGSKKITTIMIPGAERTAYVIKAPDEKLLAGEIEKLEASKLVKVVMKIIEDAHQSAKALIEDKDWVFSRK